MRRANYNQSPEKIAKMIRYREELILEQEILIDGVHRRRFCFCLDHSDLFLNKKVEAAKKKIDKLRAEITRLQEKLDKKIKK
jgi:polyhydroxyalkanoate synthesis regulator phasin